MEIISGMDEELVEQFCDAELALKALKKLQKAYGWLRTCFRFLSRKKGRTLFRRFRAIKKLFDAEAWCQALHKAHSFNISCARLYRLHISAPVTG